MQKFVLVLVALLLLQLSEAEAQRSAESSLVNFNRSAGTYSFDIHARRTNGGTSSILVGMCSFFVNYNNAALSTPTLTNVNSRFSGPPDHTGDYDPMTIQILAGRIAVTVWFTGNSTGSGQALTPDGEQVCTVNLTIVDASAAANVSWDNTNSALTDMRSVPVENSFIGADYTLLPVQLSSFIGREIPGRGVGLEWTTVSETNNYGFYIQRRLVEDSLYAELPTFIPGHGTTSQQQEYAFIDSLVSRGSWRYRLRQVDLSGAEFLSDAIIVGVLTGMRETAPLVFALHQNYPNPFNPSTAMKFSVEKTDRATLDIYNILGQHVARLYDETAEAGLYHTVRFEATNFASGTYIYRLESGGKTQVRKLLLLK